MRHTRTEVGLGPRPDWLDYELNCLRCGEDMWMNGAVAELGEGNDMLYCPGCPWGVALSDEMVDAVRTALDLGIYNVPTVDVAQAIMDWDGNHARTLRSHQWRRQRIDHLLWAIELHPLSGAD